MTDTLFTIEDLEGKDTQFFLIEGKLNRIELNKLFSLIDKFRLNNLYTVKSITKTIKRIIREELGYKTKKIIHRVVLV